MMNQRIQELAEQAEIKFESHPQHQGVDTAVIIPTDLKNFAELIVKEVFNRISEERFEVYEPVVQSVKQYFGVEE